MAFPAVAGAPCRAPEGAPCRPPEKRPAWRRRQDAVAGRRRPPICNRLDISARSHYARGMKDPTIARVRFDDGSQRFVFETLDGRQYVFDDEGEPVPQYVDAVQVGFRG
jgi:hypothetical protein